MHLMRKGIDSIGEGTRNTVHHVPGAGGRCLRIGGKSSGAGHSANVQKEADRHEQQQANKGRANGDAHGLGELVDGLRGLESRVHARSPNEAGSVNGRSLETANSRTGAIRQFGIFPLARHELTTDGLTPTALATLTVPPISETKRSIGFLKSAMPKHLDYRNDFGKAHVANLEIASNMSFVMRYGMLTRQEFLAAIEAKAASRAEIARALGISPAAVTLIYGGQRKLSYDEAVKLADIYHIDPNQLTEDKLVPVLRICLRHAPKEWSDHSVGRLAQEILYGLELLRFVSPIGPSQETIEVAARAIADRFQSNSDEA